jgi:hypothetical protein
VSFVSSGRHTLPVNFIDLPNILEEFRSGDGLGVLVKTKRTGVVQALVERAKEAEEAAGGVVQAVKLAFGVEVNDEAGVFVQCVLALQTRDVGPGYLICYLSLNLYRNYLQCGVIMLIQRESTMHRLRFRGL